MTIFIKHAKNDLPREGKKLVFLMFLGWKTRFPHENIAISFSFFQGVFHASFGLVFEVFWGLSGAPPGAKWDPMDKNYAKLHYSHEEITFFSPKTTETLAFCPPAEGHFWRVLWKSSKTLVFNAFLPSEISPKKPWIHSLRMIICPVSPPNPSFLKLTFVP